MEAEPKRVTWQLYSSVTKAQKGDAKVFFKVITKAQKGGVQKGTYLSSGVTSQGPFWEDRYGVGGAGGV